MRMNKAQVDRTPLVELSARGVSTYFAQETLYNGVEMRKDIRLVGVQKVFVRQVQDLCKIHQFNIGYKPFTGLNALNSVFINI